MTSPHQFSLRWDNYNRHISLALDSLRSQEDLVDVTLSCEGRKIRAHKILLSACSPYFRDIFKENPCQHPVIVFRNVKYEDLTAIIEFMYQGEVNVVQESLPSFLHTAELLSVQGLTENKDVPQQTETLQMPKLTKYVPLRATTSTSSDFLDIPPPTLKKQKISLDSTQILIDDDDNNKQYFSNSPLPERNEQKHQLLTSTNVQIQTDDDENFEHDDDNDEKNFIAEGSFEIDDDMEENCDEGDPEMDDDDNSKNKNILQTHEIRTVEMSRIFTTKSSPGESSKMQDAELKFRCSICWKGFKHPNSLTLHKDLHNGKTKCPVCYRAFSRSYDMKTHMTKIHKLTFSLETKFNLSESK